MNFEIITKKDIHKLKELQPEDWSDITPSFEFYIRSPFCKPIMTKLNSKIVGIGSLISFERTNWIGHMIVHKDFRSQGIGMQLMLELISYHEQTGADSCLLIASEMGRPLYLKIGFRDVTEYLFFKKMNAWQNSIADQHVIPFNESFRSTLYNLDGTVSGENRQRLLKDHLDGAKVYVKNGKMEGYYLPNLKDGLIIADTEEAGLALMENKYSIVDKAVLPLENKAGMRFLNQNGFVKTSKTGTRMIYGKDINWKPEKLYSRISGNLG